MDLVKEKLDFTLNSATVQVLANTRSSMGVDMYRIFQRLSVNCCIELVLHKNHQIV